MRVLERAENHTRAKRSYAEFNKMLSYAYSEGFFIKVAVSDDNSDIVCWEITSEKELLRLMERVFEKLHTRSAGGIDQFNKEVCRRCCSCTLR